MGRDGRILFAARIARLFAYGFLSVILVFYLKAVGLSDRQIGWLFALTLVGDIAVSLWLTTTADRFGRRKTLVAGALLMTFAGVLFATTNDFTLLLIAATLGVISLSGYEIGPFLSVEQASLSQILPDSSRTAVFAWYNLVGSFATALGSLAGGVLAQSLQTQGMSALGSYRVILSAYAAAGVLLALTFWRLSSAVEVAIPEQPREESAGRFGLHRSKGVVAKLSALFAIDAFGGGFVIAGIIAYWFNQRFGVKEAAIGQIIFWANILAGVSALAAARLADRIGLIETMVWTHVPSNLLLILVPLMPNLPLAILVLLLRFSISQMDVPTRQSYMMAAVDPDERSAAAGVAAVARSMGAAASGPIVGALLGNVFWLNGAFYIGGGMKLLYDALLYHNFQKSRRS
ncbi:MAG: MFS transporter [Elusimicrobia bacterium]|nr:MFS transporter [Elusimicrobiota bacterium]